MKKTKKILLLVILFLSTLDYVTSQGKLLLIGGGTEYEGTGSWNGEAFSWAVSNSENKKVAVISYSSSSSWIPDHFVSDWGAAEATNFVINDYSAANAQSTYDNLMQYDVFYIKGGDQYNYYSTYNNTKTEQAIVDKFNDGGVICGTSAGLAILSGVDFIAENGTVYPDECLEDWNNQYITLANDFAPLLEGYIFDSHFVERNRFARLTAFLANWKTKQGENLIGIGVDDMTALAVSSDSTATAYGSGAVNFYIPVNDDDLIQEPGFLAIDSLKVIQLLDSMRIDLSNLEVNGFENYIEPQKPGETGNYSVYFSGSDSLQENLNMIDSFVNEEGNDDDFILILSQSSGDILAGEYQTEINNLGYSNTEIYAAVPQYAESAYLENLINKADKILIVNNNWSEFKEFITGSNGSLLKEKLSEPGMISCFVGDNSRFTGKTVVENFDDPQASINGDYLLPEGLGLFETSVVIPKTYNPDFGSGENTAAAIPYAMVKKSLSYGIWLSKGNYIHYKPNNDQTFFSIKGNFPVMILKNKGTMGEAVSRRITEPTGRIRMIGGYKEMFLSVIKPGADYKVGNEVDDEVTGFFDQDEHIEKPDVFYNGMTENLVIDWNQTSYLVEIFNVTGTKILQKECSSRTEIPVSSYQTGIYIVNLRLKTKHYHTSVSKKLIFN